MALSFANSATLYRGAITVKYVEITGDSSWTSGGEAVNASDFGFSELRFLDVMGSTNGYFGAQYERTNDNSGVLHVYVSGTPSTNSGLSTPLESSIGRDFSAEVFYCIAYGR